MIDTQLIDFDMFQYIFNNEFIIEKVVNIELVQYRFSAMYVNASERNGYVVGAV